jgi:hypothetical protein
MVPQAADITWMLISSALVFLMIPGVGLFYSGASDRQSALSMIWLSIMTTSIIGLQVRKPQNPRKYADVPSGIYGDMQLHFRLPRANSGAAHRELPCMV